MTSSHSDECSVSYAVRVTYHIRVSHLRFAIGGEHYYGKAYADVERVYPGGRTRWLSDDQRPRVDIEQPMTAKMATYLNKKDRLPGDLLHSVGDLTTRFDTAEEVIAAGIKLLTDTYGQDIEILATDPDGNESVIALTTNTSEESCDAIPNA